MKREVTEKKLAFLVKSPCYKANGYDGAYYSVSFTNEKGDVIKGFGDHISEASYGIRNVFEAEGTSFSDEDRFISIQKIEINEKKFDAFVKKYQKNCALSDKIISERLKRFGDSPYNYVYKKKEGQAERLKEYEEWKKANPHPKDIYYDFLELIK
ncbi:hypothetical protein [Capnocytophaga sp.]|uniref:hypothetical protein n=1 Tax=Capnocytophaga sp. TaxID=44737 RepID=UPI0026DB1C94|nr:hypothetical protein [Capnocytophaga sp.]MDO5106133.1 hypothetical protein [Capnocytophaga sp.]